MKTFKYKLGEKLMSNIAAPRNAESFGSLYLYLVIARTSHETENGVSLIYQLRQCNVRDGNMGGIIAVEEESLISVEEYNVNLDKAQDCALDGKKD